MYTKNVHLPIDWNYKSDWLMFLTAFDSEHPEPDRMEKRIAHLWCPARELELAIADLACMLHELNPQLLEEPLEIECCDLMKYGEFKRIGARLRLRAHVKGKVSVIEYDSMSCNIDDLTKIPRKNS